MWLQVSEAMKFYEYATPQGARGSKCRKILLIHIKVAHHDPFSKTKSKKSPFRPD